MAVRLKDQANTQLTSVSACSMTAWASAMNIKYPKLDSVFVMDELTSFNLAQDGKSWSIPASFETYELLYRNLPVKWIMPIPDDFQNR